MTRCRCALLAWRAAVGRQSGRGAGANEVGGVVQSGRERRGSGEVGSGGFEGDGE